MQEFLSDVFIPLFISIVGLVVAVLKAIIFRTPLARFSELKAYHRYLRKPIFWSFLVAFVFSGLIGIFVNHNVLEVMQKAILFGLYCASAAYVFMLWAANLIRRSR